MTCTHCGHELQFDPRLNAWTCICGMQVFGNVHPVRKYNYDRCGKELIAIKARRKTCNDCLNAARRQRNTDARARYKREATASA